MLTKQLINELELLAERHKDDTYFTFATRWIDVLQTVIGKLKELDWQTGTPTEEGLYLVLLDGHYHKDTSAYIVALWGNSGWRMTIQGTYYNLEEKVIAWQKIEPYKDASK